MNLKQEVEAIRTQLGPDWLQTLAAQKPLTNQSSSPLSNSITTSKREITEDDLYLKGPVDTASTSSKTQVNNVNDNSKQHKETKHLQTSKDMETNGLESSESTHEAHNSISKVVNQSSDKESVELALDEKSSPRARGVNSPELVIYSSPGEQPEEVDYGKMLACRIRFSC